MYLYVAKTGSSEAGSDVIIEQTASNVLRLPVVVKKADSAGQWRRRRGLRAYWATIAHELKTLCGTAIVNSPGTAALPARAARSLRAPREPHSYFRFRRSYR